MNNVIQETVIYADPKQFGIDVESPVIAIKVGEQGYYPIYSKESADELNTEDITTEIVESAIAGSMFGWSCPAANAALRFAAGV